jgi:transcriptional regulator with XRE-family HTH domain
VKEVFIITFGEKLLQLRKTKGLSQEDLALQLNVSRQAVSRWEVGTALPDSPNLLQISKLFGVTTDYLLNDDFESDQDIPAIKQTEDSMKKEHNRQIALIVLVGLHALSLLWGVMGVFFYQALWVIYLAISMHIVIIIAFEAGYHRYPASNESSEAREYRRKYYRISVWLFAYLPLRMLMVSLSGLYLKPYYHIAFEGIILIVYLVVCSITTIAIRKK